MSINSARLPAARALVARFIQAGKPPPPRASATKSVGGKAPNAADPERSPAGWPVSRTDLARQLTARLAGGDEPNQVQTSYCGPAAFLYCLLQGRPDVYTAYALSLWLYGHYTFRGRANAALDITAVDGAKRSMAAIDAARKANPKRGSISDLDWMTMACLSVSTRPFSKWMGAPKPDDEGPSISYPWMVKGWFAAIGAPAQVDMMGPGILSISLSEFLLLMNFWPSCWIVLQIDASLLQGGATNFFTNRHWVVVDPYRRPLVQLGAKGAIVPLGNAARPAALAPLSDLATGQPIASAWVDSWKTNLRFVSWGRENYAMAEQRLGELVGRVYGGFAFPRLR